MSTPIPATPKPIKLSRHKQWTHIDDSDRGASGYTVGRGPRQNWYGLDMLTNRKIDDTLWNNLESAQGPGGDMGRVRAAQEAILSAGYTMADMGKEGVVAGGLSGMRWAADPNKMKKWGWTQGEDGSWRHKSWGDANIEYGDYEGSYDDYRKGLVDTQKEPEAEAPAPVSPPVEEAIPVPPAQKKAASINRIARNPSLGPKRMWKDQKFGATGLA